MNTNTTDCILTAFDVVTRPLNVSEVAAMCGCTVEVAQTACAKLAAEGYLEQAGPVHFRGIRWTLAEADGPDFGELVDEFAWHFGVTFRPEAKQALIDGCEQDDGIAQLEFVGFPTRALALLDEAGYIYLWELLVATREELLDVPQVDRPTVKSLAEALTRYDEVSAGQAKIQAVEQERLQAYGSPRWESEFPPRRKKVAA